MVAFQQTIGGYKVLVNEECFGYISKERGFFTDPTVVRGFMEVSIEDFRAIQEKIREIVHLPDRTSATARGDRKGRALMIIIQKMIATYQNGRHRGNLDEDIFKLFEKAKRVHYAQDDRSLIEAIEDI
jgi:hypothetical protein